MNVRWNDIFQLPEAALAGDKRVPKTMLVKQAALTKHEQRTLNKIKRLEHFATVTKATTHITPLVDGEHDIQSIIFLRCEMAGGTQAVSEVAHLVHKCFPNPTAIMQELNGGVCLSVSLTRKSHAEHGATVIDRIETTGIFDKDAPGYASLLDSLAFSSLPQDDLLTYLQTIAWNVALSRAIGDLGFFPQCTCAKRDELASLIRAFDTSKADLKRLEDVRRGPDISLNESAKLRMETKKIEKKLNGIVAEIKELCNDRVGQNRS